ncbi:hypothetical protein AAIA72_04650 [Hahella sp. SMD15-11]|uniref:DUF2513 domain-containing protein n=1 Tax=Thermohahella caldifontis TaxID=3142973 RepID=A0AB39UZ77_9GAMM
MHDLHIDDFFKDAARILLQLYMAFPRPILLIAEDISGPDTPDEYGLHSPRHQACLATMLWLAEEGWLRYESQLRQEGLDQAVLTARSVARLSASASPGVSRAHELADLIRHGTSDALRTWMQALLFPH